MDTETTNAKWFNSRIYKVLADDSVRNSAYRSAINQVVTNDSKVIEIGTGDRAYLTQMCIENAPHSVTTIEANKKAYYRAKSMLEKCFPNDHNIQILHGLSNEITVESKGNVLVQEIIGSIASSEGVGRIVEDAKSRLLAEEVSFVPACCNTWVAPVGELRLSLVERCINSAIRSRIRTRNGNYRVFNFPKNANIAQPKIVENLDFANDLNLVEHQNLTFEIEHSCSFTGLVCYVELIFSEANRIDAWNDITNWSTPYIKMSNKPVPLVAGDRIQLVFLKDIRSATPKYTFLVSIETGGETLQFEAFWKGV